jgi:capsular polysaccharide biosynthesis protein
MSASPFRRWNPDEVITRRKRLFWLITLLGLISGIAFSFSPLLRWKTASGTLQIRTQSLPGETTLLFTTTDLADAIPSDEVLEKTAIALNLSKGRQGENQEPVASLRTRISCRPIPGTDLVELSAKGSDRADAERIWHGLISSANEHLRTRRADLKQTWLAAIAVKIEHKKAEVEIKSEELRRYLGIPKPRVYDNPLDLRGPTPRLIKLQGDLREAQEILANLEIAETVGRMNRRLIEDPVFIHESPSARSSILLSRMPRALTVSSTIGLGAGMVLAVVLAYLLELLFPRKFPTG